MATARQKEMLQEWLTDILIDRNGEATIIEICIDIWDKYEDILRDEGELFYTWQYDVRWVASDMRKRGLMEEASSSGKGLWQLV